MSNRKLQDLKDYTCKLILTEHVAEDNTNYTSCAACRWATTTYSRPQLVMERTITRFLCK